ncbi:hypothetical protein AGMMS49938_12130 [Fibrobacterales bacterium]|nr:hypothetical protein AGMMS49938_12130 [Fibrobacterales bacterium]
MKKNYLLLATFLLLNISCSFITTPSSCEDSASDIGNVKDKLHFATYYRTTKGPDSLYKDTLYKEILTLREDSSFSLIGIKTNNATEDSVRIAEGKFSISESKKNPDAGLTFSVKSQTNLYRENSDSVWRELSFVFSFYESSGANISISDINNSEKCFSFASSHFDSFACNPTVLIRQKTFCENETFEDSTRIKIFF